MLNLNIEEQMLCYLIYRVCAKKS